MTQEDESFNLSSKYHLLPHERPLANRVYKIQTTLKDTSYLYLNYGPDGVFLQGASIGSVIPFVICAIGGTILMAPLGGHGILLIIGLILWGIGIIFFVLFLFRSRQCSKIGKKFRGERPFINPKKL